MNSIRFLISLMIFLGVFFGCGSDPNSESNKFNPISSLAHASAYIEADGDKIAYVMSIGSGYTTVFLIKEKLYVSVELKSGLYQKHYGYFENLDCSGGVVTIGFPGEAGKSIVFANDRYFLVSESKRSVDFQYQSNSQVGAQSCKNISGPSSGLNLDVDSFDIYNLSEVSKPYDFTSIAPLQINFE